MGRELSMGYKKTPRILDRSRGLKESWGSSNVFYIHVSIIGYGCVGWDFLTVFRNKILM